MSVNDPGAFIAQDPMVWRPLLDDTDFEHFVRLRASVAAGETGAADAVKAPTISAVRTASSSALAAAGFGGEGDKERKARADFETQMLRWADTFTRSEGREPTPLEINDRVNQMLVPIVIDPRGLGNKQSGAGFQIDYDGKPFVASDDLTPEDIRDGALAIGGETVSNDIIEMFAQTYQDRFGRAPTVQELVEGLIESGLYDG
jgi:hypothetical protein